jgi:protein-tyrosine phosphatase
MLIPDAVHIWRDDQGDYHLEWDASEPDTRVTVELLSSPIELREQYRAGHTTRARFAGLPSSTTHYFRLHDQHGTEFVATERKLGMQGAPNFRDYGGYKTALGRQVKWGFLYRSGHLSKLTEQDISLLASLRLDLICDFRRVEEQLGDPSRLPGVQPPKVLSLPITPGSNANFFEQAGGDFGGRQAMFDFMVDINTDFAVAQTSTYKRMFAEILDVNDARFLVHCAAGKDRTGFAAAMVLAALGVERDVILRDYLMTGRYFMPDDELDRIRQKYQMDLPSEAILPMLQVHEDYLCAALGSIDARYPSTEVYLAEELGVGASELSELRGRYLQ